MLRFLIGRLGSGLFSLLLLSILACFALASTHTNPAVLLLGRHFTRAAYDRLVAAGGYNLSVWSQYLLWLRAAFTTPALPRIIVTLLPATMELVVVGSTISLVLVLITVTVQAMDRRGRTDRTLSVLAYLFYALPAFWLGTVLLWWFADLFTWLPATGPSAATPGFANWAIHMVLPVATLVLVTVGGWARYLRADVDEVLRQDFIRTARAKGVGEFALVVRHAMRNSLLPLVTLLGMSFPSLLNTVIVIEIIYAMSGLGSGLVGSLIGLDYAGAVEIALVLGALAVAGSLLSDLVYVFVDPRISYS